MTRQQIVSSIENGVTDFSNKDLSNLDLGLNFEKFNLSRANLSRASLSDAKNIFIFNGISGRTCYAVVFENEEPSVKYLMIKAGCFFDNLSEFKSASKAKGEKYEAQIQYLEILETLLNRK